MSTHNPKPDTPGLSAADLTREHLWTAWLGLTRAYEITISELDHVGAATLAPLIADLSLTLYRQQVAMDLVEGLDAALSDKPPSPPEPPPKQVVREGRSS